MPSLKKFTFAISSADDLLVLFNCRSCIVLNNKTGVDGETEIPLLHAPGLHGNRGHDGSKGDHGSKGDKGESGSPGYCRVLMTILLYE